MSVQYPDKRVKRTKETLKTVLLSLMEKKDFHSITITEIVKAADFNRGTFYAHYQQKEDLLDELVNDMFTKMAEAYRNPYQHLSVLDLNDIPTHSIIFFDHFYEHKKFYHVMLKSGTTFNFHEKLRNKLEQLLKEDFDLPISELDSNIEFRMFVTFRVHGLIGLILEWIENDFPDSPSYMGEQLIHILKLFTPKYYVKNQRNNG
ncbi:TetR/AcrR family transcriptional regulator [Bacillus sp. B15-48]|uniref:TetR/AcrR family transcriptional regulator n=1 Tax=Bacillus sp. B15-48 TaxID=1548601 RepID=UPI00193ED358|nr:TetR/AcrR family transcriptional regulator [Bacillus sp. B15-48]MBM4763326.1 TetR family transcriptional regulator [Bacillus sp. B15-48]